jgi:6-methylsalicylate decarboxylase
LDFSPFWAQHFANKNGREETAMRCDPIDTIFARAHGCRLDLCGCGSRRAFLKSAAAFAGSALAAPAILTQAAAQGAPPSPSGKAHRIDVHHHFFPPFLLDAWQKAATANAPLVRNWTLARSLEQMDHGGVATAILSIPTGLNLRDLSDEQIRQMTRKCNDFAVQAGKDHSGRFGLFALMPMPHIDATLKEIEYALDVIKADGIGLNTSYGDKWLGDPTFKPVLDELNRRKAVLYVHPLGPQCCSSLMSHVPPSFTEYPQDTNRAVMSLLFSGTFTRTRDISWIFSHAGAAVPLLAGRVNALSKAQIRNTAELLPDGVDFELKRLRYETANAAYAPNMAALLKFAPLSQVLFGTDYPYVSVVENVADLNRIGLSAAELKAIERDNAVALLPRLKA